MNSPAIDIAGYLATKSIGTVGSTIFVSKLPDSPDALVLITSQTSREPSVSTSGTGSSFTNIDRPNIQALVRANIGQNSTGYAKALAVKEALHGMGPFTLNGSKYHSIFAMSDVGDLGVDEKLRPVFSINFRVERSKV